LLARLLHSGQKVAVLTFAMELSQSRYTG